MDRNGSAGTYSPDRPGSLSARRAWIEMLGWLRVLEVTRVALRKESVDRNNKTWWVDIHTSGRSPQGERG